MQKKPDCCEWLICGKLNGLIYTIKTWSLWYHITLLVSLMIKFVVRIVKEQLYGYVFSLSTFREHGDRCLLQITALIIKAASWLFSIQSVTNNLNEFIWLHESNATWAFRVCVMRAHNITRSKLLTWTFRVTHHHVSELFIHLLEGSERKIINELSWSAPRSLFICSLLGACCVPLCSRAKCSLDG